MVRVRGRVRVRLTWHGTVSGGGIQRCDAVSDVVDADVAGEALYAVLAEARGPAEVDDDRGVAAGRKEGDGHEVRGRKCTAGTGLGYV